MREDKNKSPNSLCRHFPLNPYKLLTRSMSDTGGAAQTSATRPPFESLKNKSPKLENYIAGSVFLKTDIIFRNNSSLLFLLLERY